MLNKKVPARQLWAWIATAVSAPLTIYAGYASWEWILLAGLVCTAVCLTVCKMEQVEYGRILSFAQLAVIGVVGGIFASDVSACWETEGYMMPLTLIALAVVSSIGGAERASRVPGILAWILALLYIISLAAGVQDLNLDWLAPTGQVSGMLITAFLVPAVAVMLPHEKGKFKWLILAIPIFAAIIGVWCTGTLSIKVAKEMELPFYEYSKSLSLFGVAERFESLISVALTMGVFCTLSLLFSAAESTMKNGAVVSGIGAAIIVWGKVRINGWILSSLALFAWVILPAIKNEIKYRKK